jgi:hypothetical protein
VVREPTAGSSALPHGATSSHCRVLPPGTCHRPRRGAVCLCVRACVSGTECRKFVVGTKFFVYSNNYRRNCLYIVIIMDEIVCI